MIKIKKNNPKTQILNIEQTAGWQAALALFAQKDFRPFAFQTQTWKAVLEGKSGLLNAPTGSGKTLALWMPAMIKSINEQAKHDPKNPPEGLQMLWVTPLRALAQDLTTALSAIADQMSSSWKVGLRSSDTPSSERTKQRAQPPQALVITPESLHVLLSYPDHEVFFKHLNLIVIDEWHDLLGSKRGTLTELALARLANIRKENMNIWGISATIENLDQALNVLLGSHTPAQNSILIQADFKKDIDFITIIPTQNQIFSWNGHLGFNLIPQILPYLEKSQTSLIFTNTRAAAELWYQNLLLEAPWLAGQIALHHGSLDTKVRTWVEDSIKKGSLKVVVCTSSLDLGVDFAPVQTIVQIGSPKSASRLTQRAGRSGHRPGQRACIVFVPAHLLELVDAAALEVALKQGYAEPRYPVLLPYDVLLQYMSTRALGGGLEPAQMLSEIRQTRAFETITDQDFQKLLDFSITGGKGLGAYDEFVKLQPHKGIYYLKNKKAALMHRLSIGAIASQAMLKVRYVSGGYLGQLDENFAARLKSGQAFWLGGKCLIFNGIKKNEVYARKGSGKGIIPQWSGSRLPVSSGLACMIRDQIALLGQIDQNIPLHNGLANLAKMQNKVSAIPAQNQILIEQMDSREGTHLFVYPFEGRAAHQSLATLLAFRLASYSPSTFSIAANDYGFELLSENMPDWKIVLEMGLFSIDNLESELKQAFNQTEMAKREFRDIAHIAGLIFRGYPGAKLQDRHLQTSSNLLFDVFSKYEPDNLLMRQAQSQLEQSQIELERLEKLLLRLQNSQLIIKQISKPSPFAFPIFIDRLREKISSEALQDRIERMIKQMSGK